MNKDIATIFHQELPNLFDYIIPPTTTLCSLNFWSRSDTQNSRGFATRTNMVKLIDEQVEEEINANHVFRQDAR